MGQASSGRMLQQTTDSPSDTAKQTEAARTHSAMLEEKWKAQLLAKLRSLQKELRRLIEEGALPAFPLPCDSTVLGLLDALASVFPSGSSLELLSSTTTQEIRVLVDLPR